MSLEDIELAIEDLDKLVEIARENYTIAGYLGVVHSANFIIETLEKQIPQKVIRIEDVASQACPLCKSKVNGNYCSNCGQNLIY